MVIIIIIIIINIFVYRHKALTTEAQGGPRNHVLGRVGRDPPPREMTHLREENIWACLDLPKVSVLIVIRSGDAAFGYQSVVAIRCY